MTNKTVESGNTLKKRLAPSTATSSLDVNPEVIDNVTHEYKGIPKPIGKITEFGGIPGCIGLILFSHFVVMYFYICLNHNYGNLLLPTGLSLSAFADWFSTMANIIVEHASPTVYAFKMFWIFQFMQYLCAITLPGVEMMGLPVLHEGGKRYKYLCNALTTWYVTLVTTFLLHYYDIFRITEIVDHLGPLTIVAMLSADAIAVAVYLSGFVCGTASPDRSGNVLYDFFMGSVLNPRIGSFDIKMFAEIRISWIMLFLISTSAAVKQYEAYGHITYSMGFILLAHLLYVNAIMKGEDCVITSFDIHTERFGWMLIFWNFCGVAFVYTVQSMFIFRHTPEEIDFHWSYYAALTVVLVTAYYIFDTANSQKNRFRMVLNGTNVDRPYALPQFSYGTLRNPEYLVTKIGTPLLVDGWYKYARKLHYTVDLVMALTWGMSCGFDNFIPYFYVCFFTAVLVHRVSRDEIRMRNKYGEDFERYAAKVPYRFIPGVY